MTTKNENVIDIIVGNNNEIQQNLYRTVSEVQSSHRGVDSFLNPGWGAGSTVRGIICPPGLNRVY